MASDTDQFSVKTQGVKIALIVLCLGTAGFIAYTSTRTELEQPDTPDTATTYVCVECGEGMDLTAAEYAKISAGDRVRQAPVGELRGYSFLECPKCHKHAVVRGARCPKDQTPIPQATKDGKPGRCKKCGYALIGN